MRIVIWSHNISKKRLKFYIELTRSCHLVDFRMYGIHSTEGKRPMLQRGQQNGLKTLWAVSNPRCKASHSAAQVSL